MGGSAKKTKAAIYPKTIKLFKDRGYEVGSTEQFNFFTKTSNDLFGFIDKLAIRANEILAIQITTDTHRSKHIRKMAEEPRSYKWLAAGGKIVLISWYKEKNRWKYREDYLDVIQLDDYIERNKTR